MIDDIERAGRVREAEAHLLERRRMLERQNLAEEREIARVLDLMEEQRALDQKALHELKRSKSELEVSS